MIVNIWKKKYDYYNIPCRTKQMISYKLLVCKTTSMYLVKVNIRPKYENPYFLKLSGNRREHYIQGVLERDGFNEVSCLKSSYFRPKNLWRPLYTSFRDTIYMNFTVQHTSVVARVSPLIMSGRIKSVIEAILNTTARSADVLYRGNSQSYCSRLTVGCRDNQWILKHLLSVVSYTMMT